MRFRNTGATDSHTIAAFSGVIPRFVPELTVLAASLKGTDPAYGIAKAQEQLGYVPRYHLARGTEVTNVTTGG